MRDMFFEGGRCFLCGYLFVRAHIQTMHTPAAARVLARRGRVLRPSVTSGEAINDEPQPQRWERWTLSGGDKEERKTGRRSSRSGSETGLGVGGGGGL